MWCWSIFISCKIRTRLKKLGRNTLLKTSSMDDDDDSSFQPATSAPSTTPTLHSTLSSSSCVRNVLPLRDVGNNKNGEFQDKENSARSHAGESQCTQCKAHLQTISKLTSQLELLEGNFYPALKWFYLKDINTIILLCYIRQSPQTTEAWSLHHCSQNSWPIRQLRRILGNKQRPFGPPWSRSKPWGAKKHPVNFILWSYVV